MRAYKVGYLIGSLAIQSINRKLVQALIRLVAAGERTRGLYPVQAGMITDEGEVTAEDTEAFLRNFMTESHIFIERVLTVLPRDDWRIRV